MGDEAGRCIIYVEEEVAEMGSGWAGRGLEVDVLAEEW